MAIFNSYVKLPEGINNLIWACQIGGLTAWMVDILMENMMINEQICGYNFKRNPFRPTKFITFTGWWFQPTPLKNMSSSVGNIIHNWMESHKIPWFQSPPTRSKYWTHICPMKMNSEDQHVPGTTDSYFLGFFRENTGAHGGKFMSSWHELLPWTVQFIFHGMWDSAVPKSLPVHSLLSPNPMIFYRVG